MGSRKASAILRFWFRIAAGGDFSRDSSFLRRIGPFVPTLPRIISWPSDCLRMNGPESLIAVSIGLPPHTGTITITS